MVRLRLARSAAEIEQLRPLWCALESAPGATLFQSYDWNLAAARHLAAREQPYVVAVESDAGATIVPAAITADGNATFLGEMLFDYRDALLLGEARVLDEAMNAIADAAPLLALPAIREDGVLFAQERGAKRQWVGAPVLRSADLSSTAFLAQHFKARKQMRRLLRAGARFGRRDGNAPAMVRWLYERKAAQFAGTALDIFSDPARRDCVQAIIASTKERTDIFTIESGAAVIAVLVTFRDRSTRRLYTIWHDPAWEQYSPGIVLLLQACAESLREGLDVDFLTGEQPHKARFATSRVQLYRFHATAEELRSSRAQARIAA